MIMKNSKVQILFLALGSLVLILGVLFYNQSQKDSIASSVAGNIQFSKTSNTPMRIGGNHYGAANSMPDAKLDFSYDRNIRGASQYVAANKNRGQQDVLAVSAKGYDVMGKTTNTQHSKMQSLGVSGSVQISYGGAGVSSASSSSASFSTYSSVNIDQPFASANSTAVTRAWGDYNNDPGDVVPIGSVLPLLLLGALYAMIKMFFKSPLI